MNGIGNKKENTPDRGVARPKKRNTPAIPSNKALSASCFVRLGKKERLPSYKYGKRGATLCAPL